ncbi:MAG: biotin-dependent carboxyltransferase family protein [Proteobacteria bacterium]|nr:biotin-dependent carboxyltransferase family protein [Pseudomonadota bacterium]
MSAMLEVVSAGPSLTVQDRGRPGLQRFGITQGGAMDTLALAEGAALLGQEGDLAAIEMAGFGGKFRALERPLRIALTGAAIRTRLDGQEQPWNTSFVLEPGVLLEIGAAEDGVYGYLHVGGGIATPAQIGSRSTHLRSGVGGLDGRALTEGDRLPAGHDPGGRSGLVLPTAARFGQREIRVMWGAQAEVFSPDERERFLATAFDMTTRRDRQGARLKPLGEPFHADGALTGVSDAVVLGDIQVPGDGMPVALLADRQPTGGYPRIATVISADLAALVQIPGHARFRFRLAGEAEALAALARQRRELAELSRQIRPLVRDPRDMGDLLAFNLVDGVISAREDETP